MRVNQILAPKNLQHQIKNKKIAPVDFGSVLSDAITHVNDAEKTAQAFDQMVATGKVENLHDAMIAAQKAEITLNFALEIRSQVLEAYKELMRLQV